MATMDFIEGLSQSQRYGAPSWSSTSYRSMVISFPQSILTQQAKWQSFWSIMSIACIGSFSPWFLTVILYSQAPSLNFECERYTTLKPMGKQNVSINLCTSHSVEKVAISLRILVQHQLTLLTWKISLRSDLRYSEGESNSWTWFM